MGRTAPGRVDPASATGPGVARRPAALLQPLALAFALLCLVSAEPVAADRGEGSADAAATAGAVVDTTGAGDTFNATFLVAHDRGAPLHLAQHLALQQACRAPTRTAAAFGTRGALAGFLPADAGLYPGVRS